MIILAIIIIALIILVVMNIVPITLAVITFIMLGIFCGPVARGRKEDDICEYVKKFDREQRWFKFIHQRPKNRY